MQYCYFQKGKREGENKIQASNLAYRLTHTNLPILSSSSSSSLFCFRVAVWCGRGEGEGRAKHVIKPNNIISLVGGGGEKGRE